MVSPIKSPLYSFDLTPPTADDKQHYQRRVITHVSLEGIHFTYEKVKNPSWYQWICCCFCCEATPNLDSIDHFEEFLKNKYGENAFRWIEKASGISLAQLKISKSYLTIYHVATLERMGEKWRHFVPFYIQNKHQTKYYSLAFSNLSPIGGHRVIVEEKENVLVDSDKTIFIKAKDGTFQFNIQRIIDSVKRLRLNNFKDSDSRLIGERILDKINKNYKSPLVLLTTETISDLVIQEMKRLKIILYKPQLFDYWAELDFVESDEVILELFHHYRKRFCSHFNFC